MPSVSVTQLFLLSALLHISTCLPVREEEEVEASLTRVRQLDAPWSPSRMNSADVGGASSSQRRLLPAGLDRRRQLGDIEFSNRYAEFLRSKAKHHSVCAFLRRVQSVRRSGAAGDSEKVNLLLKQYMCPSVYDSWPTDL
ncbi:uncharacterized protein AB9W97_012793 isoform 2-T4 [Spinachia spinachia]